jgi:hypothetical protein
MLRAAQKYAHSGLISRFLNTSAKVLINAPEKNLLKKFWPGFEALQRENFAIQEHDFERCKQHDKGRKKTTFAAARPIFQDDHRL